MYLEKFFKTSHTLQRFREGPLAPQLDGFCGWLANQGFSQHTIRNHIPRISHFSRYLRLVGLEDCSQLKNHHIDSFLVDHLPQCRCPYARTFRRANAAFSIHRFVQYLKESGTIGWFSHQHLPYQSILDDYLKWLEDYHHCAPGTVKLRRHYLMRFFQLPPTNKFPECLKTITPMQIQELFLDYAKSQGLAARRSMQGTLRTFLRFCFFKGYTRQNLAFAVPTLRTYKLQTVPRAISDDMAHNTLNAIDRKTDVGRRDFAILMLLYTYGVRAAQVRALMFEDINWRKSQLQFRALKHGKDIVVPLTMEVGESLLDYIRLTRPKFPYPQVFLTTKAPYQPLRSSRVIRQLIAKYMRPLNKDAPSYGAHLFRHCFASRLINNHQSIKAIADLMGHRFIQTTFIYTKVDFHNLNQVPLEWPEK
jgi:site-specific recombinase XerD